MYTCTPGSHCGYMCNFGRESFFVSSVNFNLDRLQTIGITCTPKYRVFKCLPVYTCVTFSTTPATV